MKIEISSERSYGVDYLETLSSTKLSSVHIILSKPLYQLHVKNSFLYGDLQVPPLGFGGKNGRKVCQ